MGAIPSLLSVNLKVGPAILTHAITFVFRGKGWLKLRIPGNANALYDARPHHRCWPAV